LVVGIGVIGCGSISWYHLRAIQSLESAEIVAAYNRSPGPRARFGTEAGLSSGSLYSDASELFGHDGLDAVVVCLPNSMHSKVSVEAMEAGLHVLCEKPMATSLAEAERMVGAAERYDRKLLIGLTRRFTGESVAAKRVVDGGGLGEVYYSKAGWMRRSGIPGWGSQFTRRDLAGAGPIYDIGVHALDNACWLMSDFEAEKVLASSYSRLGPMRRGLGDWGVHDFDGYFDVEDLAAALIKMRSGVTVVFEVSWAAHVPRSRYNVRVLGEEAGLDLETMMLYTDGEVDVPIAYEETDPYLEEMRHFVDCVEGDVVPLTAPEEMLELQAMLDMILLSSGEDRVVRRSEV